MWLAIFTIQSLTMGTKGIQFLPELWRFEREKRGWEGQKTVVRKESEELPPPLSQYGALGFPSSLNSQKPRELRHKLSLFGPPLQSWTFALQYF